MRLNRPWQCIGALTIGFWLVVSAGCAVNPVTGRSELVLVGDGTAAQIGAKNYVPAQQMQGGQYTVDPGVTAYVDRVGQSLVSVLDTPLPYDFEFVVLNNSVPNAWAMPGGKLAINRGLLVELKNEAELAAVLGHEIVHSAARHGAKSMERGIGLQAGLVLGSVLAQRSEYGGAVMGGAQVAASYINQVYGRNAERESDYYGTRYMARAGYDPQAAVALQETFVRLSGGRRTSWLEGLFASHPPSEERVANNRSLVATLREEGFTAGRFGTDDYQAAMKQLFRDRPAYESYDKAQAAYGKKDYDTALSLVNQALDQQFSEPLFHGLRGDIRRSQQRWGDAITNYNRAIERDDGMFMHYLGRGVARARSGDRRSAKSDFDRSVALLPTSIAYNELGKIAEADGQREAAQRYYEAAAASGDSAGLAARSSFYRLAVPKEPARFIATRLAQDEKGQVILMVQNKAQVDLVDIQLRLELLLADGNSIQSTPTIQRLPAGKVLRLPVKRSSLDVADGRAYALSARAGD